MRRHWKIVEFLTAGALLLGGAARAEQVTLRGSLLNIDNGQWPASVELNFEFYRLIEEYGNTNAGLCDKKHETVPVVFHVKTGEFGRFTLPDITTGQYLMVAHVGPHPISVCLTAYGMAGPELKECSRCRSMLVRYSEKRAFFRGDILMAGPYSQWVPFACDPIHGLDGPQTLPAAKVRFKYEDGRPVGGASITAYYSSLGRRSKNPIPSVETDAKGVANLADIYSQMNRHYSGIHSAIRTIHFSIKGLNSADTLKGDEAAVKLKLVRGVSGKVPELMLFKVVCGPDSSNTRWDAEVIGK
jgi:hypothetical protein